MLESCIAGLITGGAQLLTNPRVRWLGCEPDMRQRIYYSNHTSHLDFVLLWSALPPRLRFRTRPVAASDYWECAGIRRYIIHQVFHGVLAYRSELEKQKSMSEMLCALDRKESLILFPEGTRGSGDTLGQFKSGFFHLAQARPSIELVPVWITNSARVLPKGTFWPVPLLCSVTFGTPVHIEPNEERAGFLNRLQGHLLNLGQNEHLY